MAKEMPRGWTHVSSIKSFGVAVIFTATRQVTDARIFFLFFLRNDPYDRWKRRRVVESSQIARNENLRKCYRDDRVTLDRMEIVDYANKRVWSLRNTTIRLWHRVKIMPTKNC